MPSSVFEQIPEVVQAVAAYHPTSILDVGIGCGKYALLLREFLECSVRPPAASLNPITRQLRINGVEIFPDYLTDVQRLLYDTIMIGDIAQIAPTLDTYDVILLVDVIEHIERPLAVKTLDHLLAKARKGVVLSTPASSFPQGEVFGNAAERHIDTWSPADFTRWSHVQSVVCAGQLLVCISKDAAMNPWMAVMILKQKPLWGLRRRWWKWCKHWRGVE
jgi:hypothetical protein